MSTYGIKIKNFSSNIIIDDNYKNYARGAALSLNLVPGFNYLPFTPTDNPPILFIRPGTDGYSYWHGYRKYGSVDYDAFRILSSNSHTILYTIASPGNVETLTEYGFVIYNSAGEIVFSNADTYLKVVKISGISTSFPISYDSEEKQITVVDADTNFFLIRNTIHYYVAYTHLGKKQHYTCALRKINSTTLGLKPVFFSEISIPVFVPYIDGQPGTLVLAGGSGTISENRDIIEVKRY